MSLYQKHSSTLTIVGAYAVVIALSIYVYHQTSPLPRAAVAAHRAPPALLSAPAKVQMISLAGTGRSQGKTVREIAFGAPEQLVEKPQLQKPVEKAAPRRAALAVVQGAADVTTSAADRDPLVTSGLNENGNVTLMVNKSTVMQTSRPFRRISIGSPEVAEVNGIGPTRLLITAKKPGSTQLILWDEAENQQMVDIIVQGDPQGLRDLYQRLLPNAKLEVHMNENTIALTGSVPDLQTAEQAVAIAQGYSNKVLNLLEIAGGQQVMLQVQFAEVSRSASRQLGLNFGYTDGTSIFGSNVGQISPLGFEDLEEGVLMLGVPDPSPAVTVFGTGTLGEGSFAYFISAMRQNNLLRTLAEPTLITMSGQEANFLAGGEFPIPVVQGGLAESSSITVEYREFGVKLRFVPVVLGDGRIRMNVAPEVSDVDFTNAVRSGGFLIPGRRVRQLSTIVELAEGQTFAVGGLLDNRVVASKDVTPLMGDLPIVGALFRSVRYQRQETELVVLVTPRIVGGLNPSQVPALPGEFWRHPTRMEFSMKADLGGPIEGKQPRRFMGRHGFAPVEKE